MTNKTQSGKRTINRKKAGFSLMEVLIALAILALIATIVGPRAISFLSRSKTKTAELQIEELKTSLELYYLDIGRYPSESGGLKALVMPSDNTPNWNGPYLENAASLNDPWDRPYLYRSPGSKGEYEIYTLGRDGAEGGSGEDKDILKY
ncbi:type II secretion system major pseudopilin GspG [uncultured Roseibium sp.]|uniref:type II secretion system major pseudopilin GspG n=1 Tax=uncultured Roseibium sp. TaxID=1936171 RepID=UPI003216F16E